MLNRLFFLPALAVLLIVAGCSGDSSADSENDSQGSGAQAPPETQLAETYPVQLSLPGSELISSDETLDQGAVRASAVWAIEAEISDVLDFFENALATLGTQGESSRLQLGSVGSLTFQGADNGPTYASVEVESTDEGLRTVTVSYLVNAETASPSAVTESGEPESGAPEADEPDEPDETGLPANADAASLLLGVADLPTRDWRASNSTFLEVDFSTAFFDATSCSAVTAALSQILEGSVTLADLASRTFSYDADLTLVRLSFAAAVFASPGDASVFFAAIEGVVEGGLRICFLDAIVEARVRAAAQGVQLETRFGEPGFVLLQSAALEAHAESTIALVDLAANLQLHVVQRGPTVAVFVSVVANDDDLLGAIPQILAEFDRRLGGSGEAAPVVANPPASEDSGDSGAADDGGGTSADSGDTGGDTGTSGDSGGGGDDDPGARVGGAIPPALVHPDGPGGWTSEPASEGTLYTAGFNVDSQSVEEILNFYQNAFASLGAPTVTTRQVTPFSGELRASGPGGRGTARIIASSGTRAVQAEFLQFE